MITARSVEEVRAAVATARARQCRIGLVPTMGFLHEGHLSLIDHARDAGAGCVVVSIFVNPTQFGPGEDFETYPRDERRDARLLEERGVDILFAPAPDVIYPPGFSTRVVVSGPSAPLEGARRPGHFEGVATVVLKLFNIVGADLAVFGQKDAQQCAVIRKLVRDLDVPVRIEIAPTVRESDGLAMSSRNAYLTPQERSIAPALHEALHAGERMLAEEPGVDAERVEQAMAQTLLNRSGIELDYLRVVDAETFERPASMDRDLILVGAARVGRTRLIDNIPAGKETLARPVTANAGTTREK